MSNQLNLWNKTLKIGAIINQPYVFLKYDDVKKVWEPADGIEIQLLNALKEQFNFSYDIIYCNHTLGSEQANGTWTGMIGKLVQEEMDLGVGGVAYDYRRSRAVPFLYPHTITSVSFATPVPTFETDFHHLIAPFSRDVWIGFFLSLLFCLLFHFIYQKYRTGNVFWCSIYILLRQPCNFKKFNTTSLRIYKIVWLLGAFVLTTLYVNGLCSLVTIPKTISIDTVSELIEAARSNKIIVNGIENTSYFEWIKNSENFGELARVLNTVKNQQSGFEAVKGWKFGKMNAYITTRDSLYYGKLLNDRSKIHIPPINDESSLYMVSIGIPIRSSFPYRKEFEKSISWMRDTGLVLYWKMKEYSTASPTDNDTQVPTDFRPFTLQQLEYYFYFWIIATSVAFLFCIFEMAFFHGKTKVRTSRQHRQRSWFPSVLVLRFFSTNQTDHQHQPWPIILEDVIEEEDEEDYEDGNGT